MCRNSTSKILQKSRNRHPTLECNHFAKRCYLLKFYRITSHKILQKSKNISQKRSNFFFKKLKIEEIIPTLFCKSKFLKYKNSWGKKSILILTNFNIPILKNPVKFFIIVIVVPSIVFTLLDIFIFIHF